MTAEPHVENAVRFAIVDGEPTSEPGENADCPCWVVRSARNSIRLAIDGIEDATRFLDGYVSGLKLYGADTTTRYHFEDLLTELSVAQDRLERAADDLACAGAEEGDDDDE